MLLGKIQTIMTGTAVPFTRPETFSGIDKRPRTGSVRVGFEGLEGDEQGDRRVHGGPDKAIHHYPYEHYHHWRSDEQTSELQSLIRISYAVFCLEKISKQTMT